jgi:hypothetical protein
MISAGSDVPQLRFELGTKPVTQTVRETVNVTAPAQAAPLRLLALHRLPVRAGTTFLHPQSQPTALTLTLNTRSITSLKVIEPAGARRLARLQITPVVPTTRCSFMAARVWVKRTFCMRWVTALWRVSLMRKWCICTPSASFRTW